MSVANSLKEMMKHLVPVAVFTGLMFIYFYPVLENKSLVQTDVVQIKGTNHEAQLYKEKGERILWTNSSFSGMPIFTGSPANIFYYLHLLLKFIFPVPVLLTLIGFTGFYILLQSFGVSIWLSFAGAAGYVLSSFNFLSIEAGHVNKVFDIMLMAPVLAGVFLVYCGKIWKGILVTIIFLGLQVFYGHVQINYYLMFMILGIFIVELVNAVKQKSLKPLITRSIILLFVAVLVVATNIVQLWSTMELASSTTRGGSELTAKGKASSGLDYDYAFAWSSGISESFTLLVPYFKGGSSHEDLGMNSETYKTLINNGVPKPQASRFISGLPLYWGAQPFTGGPIYFGAIICFLFLLGMLIIKSPLKWWALALVILSVILSWGKNFPALTNLLYDHFPLYNKFRSVTMILSIAQLIFPFIGILAVHQLITNKKEMKNQLINSLITSAGITLGLTLIFFVMGGGLFRFVSPSDASLQFPDWLNEALRADRISKMKTDSLRSFVFIGIAAGATWMFLKDKLGEGRYILVLSAFIIIDLWMVDKRYLNSDDFKDEKRMEKDAFSMTPADKEVLQDKTPYYRVLNLSRDTFNDGITSYYHKSAGGYSAIKMGRYQELIENQISKNNMKVFDMLNIRYFILPEKSGLRVQPNPAALGNCWFVKEAKVVDNADQENEALGTFDPNSTAIVDKRFAGNLKPAGFDSAGVISLSYYHPMKMEYKSKANGDQLAVFSEIYYQPGWKSYIDGRETSHFRVNYVLRGMMIPSGEHTIVFEFRPKSYFTGEKIGVAASAALAIILLINIYFISMKKKD
jgi:hypothetical protein